VVSTGVGGFHGNSTAFHSPEIQLGHRDQGPGPQGWLSSELMPGDPNAQGTCVGRTDRSPWQPGSFFKTRKPEEGE
jgi:hypothetical protein